MTAANTITNNVLFHLNAAERVRVETRPVGGVHAVHAADFLVSFAPLAPGAEFTTGSAVTIGGSLVELRKLLGEALTQVELAIVSEGGPEALLEAVRG